MADSLDFSAKVATLKATATRTYPSDTTRKNRSEVADWTSKLLAALASTTNNNLAGGADTVLEGVLSITAGNTGTLDLTAFTDLQGTANTSFARVKFVAFWLPTTTDDATIGSNATSVKIGNSGVNATLLWMGAATDTVEIKSGGWHIHNDPSAAGLTVDATHKDLLVTNQDGTNAAKLAYLIVGGSN